MKTITRENCIEIGYFQKPHGVAGTLLLNFEEIYQETVETAEILFIETDGILVPWFTAEDGIRILSSKTALVDLDWVDDSTIAKNLTGSKVWVEKTSIRKHDNQQESDFWIGFTVKDLHKGYLGVVMEINDYSGNLVLTLQDGDTSLLIPFHPDLVVELDEQSRSLTFDLPDGLTDL
jgi:16S rRNA processing protein RimM